MKFVIKVIWVAALCFFPVFVWAQQWTSVYESGHKNTIGIGFHLSHASINDFEKNLNGVSVDYEFDDVPGYGVQMLYTCNEFLTIAVSLENIMESDVHIHTTGTKSKIGSLSTIPFTLTARLYLPTDTIIKPYIGAGFGYYFNSFDASNNTSVGSGIDIDDAFGFHYAFGADLWLNSMENTALNFDIKYLKPDTENDNLDWDAWNIAIGMTYLFN
ncbi:Outer membrane protein, OmpW [Candidatus Magnetomorum sp. HK-1]|nr:Outer membrane protein, OmpW [Candidatus Magnetomorum sp. HK-1]